MKNAICFLLAGSIWIVLTAAIPIQTETMNQDGRQMISKIFELSPGEDPAPLVEEPFEAGGFLYSYLDTVKQEIPYEEHKSVTKTVTVKSENNRTEDVLKQLESSIPYEENGFSGMLLLDTNSVKTEADGYQTSSYTVSDTREYPGLEHNDPALVPQTVTKNGLTLTLSGISWKGLGGTDTLIPTSYTAVASYRGTGSSKSATGYTTTASYTGDVMASGIQKVRYTVTYLGKEPPPFPWHLVWIGCGVLLLLTGLVAYFLLRRNVKIYRAFAGQDDYVLVGRQRITPKKPIIGLTGLKRPVIGEAAISIRKKTARELTGRQLIIETQKGVITHTIQAAHTDYWFTINTEKEDSL